ncbi:MAG: glycosyltransferase family 4 protein [Pseudomonadota bacterium]
MRTAFFTQNIKQGGLDTFVLNLLSSWPGAEEIVLFCNRSHPGFDTLHQQLAGKATVVPYDFFIAQDISLRLARAPSLLRLGFRAAFWLFGFPYLVFKTAQLFKQFDPDRLLVINGGYPGGDACLAATVAWGWQYRGRKQRAWHNFHNLVLPYSRQPLRRFKEQLIDRLVARTAAGFVTVSQACMATLDSRAPLATAQRSFIYNGIAPLAAKTEAKAETALLSELSLPADTRLILMLAVYEPRKGHAFIIHAMDELVRLCPTAALLICGDGNAAEVAAVQRLRDASAVAQRIVLQGHRQDIAHLLAQAKVLVLPSQEQESFGYTAAEAMSCGCPVVVTEVGGLPEVVDDGGSGYVVPRADASALVARIAALLQDETLRQRMGDAGKARYHALFRAACMSAQYFRLLETSDQTNDAAARQAQASPPNQSAQPTRAE